MSAAVSAGGAPAAEPAEVPARASPELIAAEAAAEPRWWTNWRRRLLDEHAAVTVASAATTATAMRLDGLRRVGSAEDRHGGFLCGKTRPQGPGVWALLGLSA